MPIAVKAKAKKKAPATATKPTAPPKKTKVWFKVLGPDGRSCHGGNFKWSLPKGDKPGAWHEIPKGQSLRLCRTGFHLTDEIRKWARSADRVVYVAEVGGEKTRYDDSDCKIAVRRVRLLRLATQKELNRHGIYTKGEHVVTKPCKRKSGTWEVRAGGTARVVIRSAEPVTCHALGNATVVATGNAKVLALESARVEAQGRAHVEACGRSQVELRDDATVYAYDQSVVFRSRTSTRAADLYHGAVEITRPQGNLGPATVRTAAY